MIIGFVKHICFWKHQGTFMVVSLSKQKSIFFSIKSIINAQNYVVEEKYHMLELFKSAIIQCKINYGLPSV
jgi:hypothetical protein